MYTLSTVVFEPMRWMNIKDISTSFDAFELFNGTYEREQVQYGDTNRHIADGQWGVGAARVRALLLKTLGLVANRLPRAWLRP